MNTNVPKAGNPSTHQVVSVAVEFKRLVVAPPPSSFPGKPNGIADRLGILLRWLFFATAL